MGKLSQSREPRKWSKKEKNRGRFWRQKREGASEEKSRFSDKKGSTIGVPHQKTSEKTEEKFAKTGGAADEFFSKN